MPINVRLSVVVPKALQEAGRIGEQAMVSQLSWAMNASVLEVETTVKEYITEIGLIKTGQLRNRIHGRVVSVNIRQAKGEVVTVDVKHARIHEYGGIIRPKNAKALAIPWNEASAHVQLYGSLRNVTGLYVIKRKANEGFGGAAFLVSSKDPRLGWTLVKSVRIREKRFMRTGLQRAMPKIHQFFRSATKRAMSIIFGKGGGPTGE